MNTKYLNPLYSCVHAEMMNKLHFWKAYETVNQARRENSQTRALALWVNTAVSKGTSDLDTIPKGKELGCSPISVLGQQMGSWLVWLKEVETKTFPKS